MSDAIEEFFSSDFADPAPAGLQQVVFAQTARLLRRRRLARRFAGIAAMAACFVAGMAAMAWLRPWPETRPLAQHREILRQAPEQPTKKTSGPSEQIKPSLSDLEWRAFDSRDNRAALYFEVAERYLLENHDYESALRCYRQALEAAPREYLAIRPNDNWLVVALKEAHQKETNHAILDR